MVLCDVVKWCGVVLCCVVLSGGVGWCCRMVLLGVQRGRVLLRSVGGVVWYWRYCVM